MAVLTVCARRSVPLEGKVQVWQHDVIPILVHLLKDRDEEVQANAAGAVSPFRAEQGTSLVTPSRARASSCQLVLLPWGSGVPEQRPRREGHHGHKQGEPGRRSLHSKPSDATTTQPWRDPATTPTELSQDLGPLKP